MRLGTVCGRRVAPAEPHRERDCESKQRSPISQCREIAEQTGERAPRESQNDRERERERAQSTSWQRERNNVDCLTEGRRVAVAVAVTSVVILVCVLLLSQFLQLVVDNARQKLCKNELVEHPGQVDRSSMQNICTSCGCSQGICQLLCVFPFSAFTVTLR